MHSICFMFEMHSRALQIWYSAFNCGLTLRCRLLYPRPTLKAVWLGVLLLWGAAAIILPIIRAEGIRAVFFPRLVRRQRTTVSDITRSHSRIALAGLHSAADGSQAPKKSE